MNRREFLQAGLAGVAAFAIPEAFAFQESSLDALQSAMASGPLSAHALTQACLARIDAMNLKGPALRAVLELNPAALTIADALDAERKAKGPRGPLHGVPILVKDNIETADAMQTTAGSLALVGVPVTGDAPCVKRLRDAGAVILGKTNLSEWANIRSTQSTSGWSARGGLCANPYALDRTPSGSSSGSGAAVAAGFAPIAVGTETDGSIVAPSSVMGLVGVKPTVGLVSQVGIIPIAASQDTAGPMARSVRDAAVLLGVMAEPPRAADYLAALSPEALRGKRLGVWREAAEKHDGTLRQFDGAVGDLRRLGAEVQEVKLPPLDEPELEVLLYELKDGVASYFSSRRPASPHKTLADLIAFNRKEAARELRWFGQELFEQAEKKGPLSSPAYKKARAACVEKARTKGIDALVAKHKLDAIVTVAAGPAAVVDLTYGDRNTPSGTSPAAVAGYPSVTVPMGEVGGLPVGLLFFGPAFSEPALLSLAFAYEQATRHRRQPTYPASAGLDRS